MTNIIYKLCIWALKRDFGNHCKGDMKDCIECQAYNFRKWLEDVITL